MAGKVPTKLQRTRLFTPGPCMVPEEVLLEMARPQEHHRTKAFIELARGVNEDLGYVFGTSGPVLTVTGSGTAAMEMAQLALCPGPGSEGHTLCVNGGKFGERWVEVCAAHGLKHQVINVAWGEAVTAGAIESHLLKHGDCRAVVLCHSETSTATACDLQAIARVCSVREVLLIVDGITAVGALPMKMDEWGVDCCVCGSQKAFMLPPGLGFVALGPRAAERVRSGNGGGAIRGLYMDLGGYLAGHEDANPPYTPNNQLIRGLAVVLSHMRAVGLEAIWHKTSCLARATRAAASALGMEVYSRSPSDSLTALVVPEGVKEKDLRAGIRRRYGIELAGGQEQLSGKIVRINHMGYVDGYDMAGLLGALEMELQACGHRFSLGAGVGAALPILAEI